MSAFERGLEATETKSPTCFQHFRKFTFETKLPLTLAQGQTDRLYGNYLGVVLGHVRNI